MRVVPSRIMGLVVWSAMAAALLTGLYMPLGGITALGVLLDPMDGLYRTARQSEHPVQQTVQLSGLDAQVIVERDHRGVPHIFADSDKDAIMALGYVVAQDRLFQLDFLPRVAAGELSEVFGPSALESDRYLRQTGMDWAARRAAQATAEEGGLEYDIMHWMSAGVNAFIDGLEKADLPLEFRLFGHEPKRHEMLQTLRLVQYFAYDLTYRTSAVDYAVLKHRLGGDEYAKLFPRHSTQYVPIVPRSVGSPAPVADIADATYTVAPGIRHSSALTEGFIEGKGSNNWAVTGSRSETGAAILAGDMHLQLSLPSIWYEIHLVTPEMNTYGVVTPGIPLPVTAFNDKVGWTLTNTGADVVDHYVLELDDTEDHYYYAGEWRNVVARRDTIHVKGSTPVIDTLTYTHMGPILALDSVQIALRWVAHERNRGLSTLWNANHARNMDDFEDALRLWGFPAQNALYADMEGNIAIWSAGKMPIRRGGHGVGLLGGTSDDFAWTGWIPFEELPHARNPNQQFLTSTNQQPVGADYPYYLGHDWGPAYRSLRIDSLLRGRAQHSVEDMKRYQSDVYAMQREFFVPLLDTLQGLSPPAQRLRDLLVAWPGITDITRSEPLVLFEFLRTLEIFTWDEPVFQGVRTPNEMILYGLLQDDPTSVWLDVQMTAERENAAGLLRLALAATADTMETHYGQDSDGWRWGDHHTIEFRHLTQTPALRALWRGPFAYPGFDNTLSPAADMVTTHSASWRVVIDFSQESPVGYGIYAGGQSGNPFSAMYDKHISDYVDFTHYNLLKPNEPNELDKVTSRLLFTP